MKYVPCVFAWVYYLFRMMNLILFHSYIQISLKGEVHESICGMYVANAMSVIVMQVCNHSEKYLVLSTSHGNPGYLIRSKLNSMCKLDRIPGCGMIRWINKCESLFRVNISTSLLVAHLNTSLRLDKLHLASALTSTLDGSYYAISTYTVVVEESG